MSRAHLEAHLAVFSARDLENLLAGFAKDAVWTTGGDELVAAELTERFTYEGVERIAEIAGFYRFRGDLLVRATIYREGSADPEAAPSI